MKRWIHSATDIKASREDEIEYTFRLTLKYDDGYTEESIRYITSVSKERAEKEIRNWFRDPHDPEVLEIEFIDERPLNKSKGMNTYVVKVIFELDPGHDSAGPEAGEQVFFIKADTEQEAIDKAEGLFSGPEGIEDVVILDVNPVDATPDDYIDM